MIRILLDQGLPRSACEFLQKAGWDVEHVSETGMSRASDSDIILRARQQDRVICTLDSDFHALIAVSGQSRPSVIRVRREGLRGKAIAELLTSSWQQIESAIDKGALITITDSNIRIRYLPVTRGQHPGE